MPLVVFCALVGTDVRCYQSDPIPCFVKIGFLFIQMGSSLSLCWASHSWPEVVAFEPLLQFSDPLGACNVVLLFPVAGG